MLSCKKETEEFISITLSADKLEAVADGTDAVTFSVVTSSGENVTQSATFWVDGSQISGKSFTSSVAGTYSVVAKYMNVVSEPLSIVFNIPLSITITSDKQTLDADGVSIVTFAVLDHQNRDVTSESKFFVNGDPIDGNTYSSDVAGAFEVSAKYLDAISSTVLITFEAVDYLDLQLTADKNTIISDGVDRIVLSCYNLTDDIDITSDVQFYVNDEAIDGHIFKTSHSGNHTITAKYEKSKSAGLDIIAQSDISVTQRVFAELVAATWCPYCPHGLLFFDSIADNPEIVAMTVHTSSSNPDPYAANAKGVSLYRSMGVGSIPTIIVNRSKDQLVSPKVDSPVSLVTQFKNSGQTVAVAIESAVGNEAITGKTFISSSDYVGDVKVVVLLAENNLIYDQRNNVKPELGNPIKNFVHNNVYRDAFDDIFGQALTLVSGNVSEMEFSFNINAEWKKDNLEIIVAVCRSDNSVINVQKVKAGKQIGY